MITEENKFLMRYIIEKAWNGRNNTIMDELVDPSSTNYTEWTEQYLHKAFPNFHTNIEDIIAEGEMVVARLKMEGTHQGEFLGVAPTGKQVIWTGTVAYRISRGKIIAHWSEFDLWGLKQQLWALPPGWPGI